MLQSIPLTHLQAVISFKSSILALGGQLVFPAPSSQEVMAKGAVKSQLGELFKQPPTISFFPLIRAEHGLLERMEL